MTLTREDETCGTLSFGQVLPVMEADDPQVRLFGRDALRFGFTPLAVQLEDFNPQASTEECRRQVAVLRARQTA